MIAGTRLRGGNAGLGPWGGVVGRRGAGRRPRDRRRHRPELGGTVLLRGDSAFYTGTVVSAARRAGARFSITVSMNPAVQRAIAGIDQTAWIPIRYPNAVWDDGAGAWVSEAEVAETCYTAFAGTKHKVMVHLVMRRVRREPPPGQDELLPAWRYHAFVTDTALSAGDADLTHGRMRSSRSAPT